MESREILRMAFGSLGVNKLRSFLTMSGISIGVFSVIGVMTAVSALRGSIETGLSVLGSNIFQISRNPTGFQTSGEARRRIEQRRNITLEQAQRYQQLLRDVTEVVCLKAFYRDGPVQASHGNRQTEPGLTFGGSNEHFLAANQYAIDLGRNFTAEDVDLARPFAILGQAVVRKLFPAESPLGKRVKLAGRTYEVIGTFAEKGSSFGQTQDEIVIVPVTRFLSDFGAARFSINLATQAPSQAVYNETLDRAITAMRIVRSLSAEQENDFEIYSNDSLIAAFAQIADVVRAGALVISAIALLAASVGIMNIMLVSVTERTKEIGVRKSVGARRSSILGQFLIEAVLLSVTGGVVGIILGVLTGNALAMWLQAEVVFPWGWAALGLVTCTFIGVAAGLYPALKAANLDPIESLRYE
jgi:putative ABC transport system permease protein